MPPVVDFKAERERERNEPWCLSLSLFCVRTMFSQGMQPRTDGRQRRKPSSSSFYPEGLSLLTHTPIHAERELLSLSLSVLSMREMEGGNASCARSSGTIVGGEQQPRASLARTHARTHTLTETASEQQQCVSERSSALSSSTCVRRRPCKAGAWGRE